MAAKHLQFLVNFEFQISRHFGVLLISGQSVHLGMGGSWSCAVFCHLWTFRHILPGILYLLLHWRVSSTTSLYTAICLLLSINVICSQGICGYIALREDKLRETLGKVRTFIPATYTTRYSEGKKTF